MNITYFIFVKEFLDEHGDGLHHIAYRVDDIDQTFDQYRKMNIPFREKKVQRGADNSRVIFIDPSYTNNILTELVERKEEVTAP